ncbi:Por secretion system C-terminal sorting domain-containing protein [Flavobacterium aquidurense]|uniref:Peptidase S8 n=1 Tax=Flavobacterium frigidimaris TaxID=262320 RepID=A0ABX4BL42_FLAFR|nr:S8 family serine peptidase [Flavobacterium frigidimaris]OXA76189.1 peptidase S8 [Flavobacterium frigidimaris]SDY30748.1 Por secretion system C-terminal sorting domain-containing protein [Flavobacterium aquidurense]
MKHIFTFTLLLFSLVMFSQEEDAWVYFKDKPNAQLFLNKPSDMLSQRSLDRRTNQNIALNSTDVPVEKTYINQVKASAGIKIMAHSKWLNALHIRGTQINIQALKSLSFVDKVVFANKALNTTAKKVNENLVTQTNDKLKTTVDYAYGNSANQIQMLNGQALHKQNYTGAGKIIAVLDGGFPNVNTAEPFKKLIDNHQILGGYDFVSKSENFYTGDNHGTMVLSTMGGYKENALIGTAPDASYYLFITEYDPTENPVEESNWVEAAEKADSLGVDIITTSLGYFEYDNVNYSHTYSDMNGTTNFISRGAEIAFSKGIIVVASAGNEGTTSEPHIGAPADAVSVLTVGSVTSAKVKSGFSSIGPSFDGRIKPDIMAQGTAAVVSDVNGNIVTTNGTSFSCPIIAGMIACLWQAYPSKTNKEIRQMILESSDKFAAPNNNYGYGIPNFGSTLGVESFQVLSHFSVFPNPAKTFVSFSFSNENYNALVSIYSVLGQKLIEKKITNQNPILSVEALDSGLYFYTFDAEGLHKTGKIIKQ